MIPSKQHTDIGKWRTLKLFLIVVLCNFTVSKASAQVYSFEENYDITERKEENKGEGKDIKTYYYCEVKTNDRIWKVETDAEIGSNNSRFQSGTIKIGASYLLLRTTHTKSKIKEIIVRAGTNKNAVNFVNIELSVNNKYNARLKPKVNDNYEYLAGFNNINTNGDIEIKFSFEKGIRNAIKVISIEFINEIEINEAADNSANIADSRNIKSYFVIKRKLSKDYWNTFCLPFDVNKDSVNLLLNNPELREFTGKVNGTTMLFRDAKEIEAGIPYIIKPSKDVVNPIFRNVIVTAIEPKTITDQTENYSFIGTYSPTELKTDGTELFLGDKDYLYKPFQNDRKINGMRAFFRIKNNTSQARQSQYNITIDETTTIALPNITIDSPATGKKIYTLDGRQVRSTHNLKAGIYIKNGKKLYIH